MSVILNSQLRTINFALRMIAVTFALPDESAIFLESFPELCPLSRGSLPFYLGWHADLEIALLHTGVGVESARSQLHRFLSAHHPVLLISSGFAGGLDPKFQTGSLLVAENYSSPALFAAAGLCFKNDPSVFYGSLTTQSVPAESIASKRSLAAQTGSLAVDMETAAIADECAAGAVPLLSIRVISDPALQRLPVPFSSWFDPVSQKARPFSLLLYLATHPAVIPDFVRFVRSVFRAKKIMASQLRNLIFHLLKSGVVHKAD